MDMINATCNNPIIMSKQMTSTSAKASYHKNWVVKLRSIVFFVLFVLFLIELLSLLNCVTKDC